MSFFGTSSESFRTRTSTCEEGDAHIPSSITPLASRTVPGSAPASLDPLPPRTTSIGALLGLDHLNFPSPVTRTPSGRANLALTSAFACPSYDLRYSTTSTPSAALKGTLSMVSPFPPSVAFPIQPGLPLRSSANLQPVPNGVLLILCHLKERVDPSLDASRRLSGCAQPCIARSCVAGARGEGKGAAGVDPTSAPHAATAAVRRMKRARSEA
mmetsp:Transcript_59714/g.133023  ORF Transcript_59714/g.133023 Transcript_59714/m.133023 type:complete len:213 (-) Transcript_59714:70-708(-)